MTDSIAREKNVLEFNADAASNKGYLYSTSDKLSCVIANRRITEAILSLTVIAGKKVIDIGCGDGVYSIELLQAGAAEVFGVDAAKSAIECARIKARGLNRIAFQTIDIYRVDEPEKRYDVAIVRGILHHLYDVKRAIDRICRVADEIIVIEPNGNNPVLKILEKISSYHIEHEEKSYPPVLLDRWFEACGGKIINSLYIGLVPMFCPDLLVKGFKKLEPIIEKLPGIRNICCGQYIQQIRMFEKGPL